MKINSLLITLSAFWVLIISLLGWRMWRYWQADSNVKDDVLEGVLTHHPYLNGGWQIVELDGNKIRVGKYPRYVVGDYLVIKGQSRLYYPTVERVKEKSWKWLRILGGWREILVGRVQRGLPEPHAGLVLGMVLGYRQDFPPQLVKSLKKTGTLHIIVVSGYNVSLVLALTVVIFARFGRKLFLPASIVFIFIYVCIVGMDPPVIRAAIMGAVSALAITQGRYKQSLYVLALTVVIMLLSNPRYSTDIGWQLSVAATLGIIMSSSLPHPSTPLMREMTVITAANMAVLPLISHYFGSVSLLGIIANMLVLWIIPFITLVGAVFIIIPLFPLKIVLVALLDYFLVILKLVNAMPVGTFEYRATLPNIIVYYVIVVSFAIGIKRAKGKNA